MTIDSFRDSFSGRILADGDDGFAAAPYPSGVPSLVVRPESVSDISAALAFARQGDLVVSVRSGGHSAGGWSSAGGGVDIDMSAFTEIAVDGTRVTIGTGATWGVVAATLGQHGLALSSGDNRSVGVGGLTLGGGVGWLVRQYGLAFDSLLSARIVSADGELVTASAEQNPDLFWAIRGGGGNFGVVVDFTFEAHALDGILHGVITFDDTDLVTILRGYRDVLRASPEELNVTFMLWPPMGPEMPGGPQLHVVYGSPDEAAGMTAIAPLLAIPGVTGHDIRPKAYVDALEEPHPPEPGAPMPVIVGNNGWAPELSDDAINAIAATVDAMGQGGVLMIRYLAGAFNRVDAEATAVAWRRAEALVISFAFLPPGADGDQIARINDAWIGTAAFTEGTYGNFLGYAGESVVNLMYPPATRARLSAVKHRWDPQNVFSQTQNILPIAEGAVS